MREMIARSCHDEMEVAFGFQAVAFSDHRLKGGGSLFESGYGVAAKLTKTKAKPEKGVTV